LQTGPIPCGHELLAKGPDMAGDRALERRHQAGSSVTEPGNTFLAASLSAGPRSTDASSSTVGGRIQLLQMGAGAERARDRETEEDPA